MIPFEEKYLKSSLFVVKLLVLLRGTSTTSTRSSVIIKVIIGTELNVKSFQ